MLDVDICKTLDQLIDRWCDRREIGPLQELLRVYPGPFVHTDQKIELLRVLKSIKGGHRNKLTVEELDGVISVHNALEDGLNA